jgi:hypothetical protein
MLKHGCLSPNVKCHTCSMCGMTCVLCNTGSSTNSGPPPPRLNELLTPRACQALLAYTLNLGEPLLVDALFLFLQCLCQWSVEYRSLIHRSSFGCVTGIRYQIGLVQEYLRTLLPIGLVQEYLRTLLPRVSAGIPLHFNSL